jgi:hypothetical protein
VPNTEKAGKQRLPLKGIGFFPPRHNVRIGDLANPPWEAQAIASGSPFVSWGISRRETRVPLTLKGWSIGVAAFGGVSILIICAVLLTWSDGVRQDNVDITLAHMLAAMMVAGCIMMVGFFGVVYSLLADHLRRYEAVNMQRDHQRVEHIAKIVETLGNIAHRTVHYHRLTDDATARSLRESEQQVLRLSEDLGRLATAVEILRDDQEELCEELTLMQSGKVYSIPVRRNRWIDTEHQ